MDLADLIRITVLVSVVLLVVGLGLRSADGDFTYLLRRPGLLARSLFAMNVLMPLLVLALAGLFALKSAVSVALLALAVSPLPPFLPDKQIGLSADRSYVYALFLTTSVLTLVFVPLTTALVADRVAQGGLAVGAAEVVGIVVMTALLPLGLGILARRLYPGAAEVIHPTLTRIGTTLLWAALGLMLATQWRAMGSLIGDGTLLVILMFTVFGLVAGHVLGGPKMADRNVLAAATSSRHPGVAVAVATAGFPGQPLVPAAVLMGSLVGMLGNALYTAWYKRALRPVD